MVLKLTPNGRGWRDEDLLNYDKDDDAMYGLSGSVVSFLA